MNFLSFVYALMQFYLGFNYHKVMANICIESKTCLQLVIGGFLPNGVYSKTCVKQPLSKRPKISFQDQLSLNAGQKYCRMLQWEHSAILLTFIKLPFVIKIFVLSIFE